MVKIILTYLAIIVLTPFNALATNGLPGDTELIVNENFELNADNWTTTNGNQGNWRIVNSSLQGTVTFSSPENPSVAKLNDFELPENYQIKAKIKGIQGVDKFFLFNFNSLNETYAINIRSDFNTGGDNIEITKNTPGNNSSIALINFDSATNVTYELSITKLNDVFYIYVDGNKIFEFEDEEPINGNSIGLLVWPGAYSGFNSVTTIQYDDIQVFVEDDGLIDFTREFSQTDEDWADEHYGDRDQNWTIGDSGCYMTSAAMLLHNFGVTQIESTVSGELVELNPKTFDEWLKENDGYSANSGFLIDVAIEWARTYRLNYNSEIPELETAIRNLPLTEGSYPSKNTTIDNFIDDEIPPILFINNYDIPTTHFTPANGYTDQTYNIFDVANGSARTLQGTSEEDLYHNEVRGYRVIRDIEPQVNTQSITQNRILSSSSIESTYDYSRITLLTIQNSQITISDTNGNTAYINATAPNTIPNTVSYTDPGTSLNANGQHIPDHHFLTIYRPEFETYEISTNAPAAIEIHSANSDFEGDKLEIDLVPDSTYSLTYNPTTGTSEVIEIPNYTTYQDLIILINQLKNQGNFTHTQTAEVWIKMLQFAQSMDSKANKVSSLTISRLQKLILNLTPNHIDQTGSDQLQAAITEFESNHFK